MDKKFRHLTIFQDDGNADIQHIKEFELQHLICLPETYKELILKHNGADFKESSFNFTNLKGEEDGRSFLFFSFGEDTEENGENIEVYNKGLQDPIYYGVPGLIGFASTAEGDTVCFDYREDTKTCNPKVVVLVHDEYDEYEDGSTHMHIEPVADTFDEFLDMLYEYVDDES
jgi:cell wall assembly regulator SMI1